MERYGPGKEGSESDRSGTGLEEPMLRLGFGSGSGGGGDGDGGEFWYPERVDEADCIYYLRTGYCGYGSRCRFNHPPDRGVVLGDAQLGGEYPERVGQPVCQFYMRTGTCKFGATCKYHHPRQGVGSVSPVPLNYYGYPLRPGEKECSYYVKTGQCKFGATCKFHHPQQDNILVPAPAAQITPMPSAVPTPEIYQTMQPSYVASSQQYGVMVARPPLLTSSYVQGPYGPVLLSPGMIPISSWSPYAAPISPVSPHNAQTTVGSGTVYGVTQLSPSALEYMGPYQSVPYSTGPSSSIETERPLPERPGQQECQHYMKTGECKFGSSCKYHHPPELAVLRLPIVLSPMGLPLRPGAPPCAHYAQRGECKFGHACKFDHPIGTLNYSPSASSLTDMPVVPYPVGSSVVAQAPSSSSWRPEHMSESIKNSSLTRMSSSSLHTSSQWVGSVFSESTRSNIQDSTQVPDTSSSIEPTP